MAPENAFSDRTWSSLQVGAASVGNGFNSFCAGATAFDQLSPNFSVAPGSFENIVPCEIAVVAECLTSIFASIRIIGASKPIAPTLPLGRPVSNVGACS